jgi:hypothetical protein
MTALIVMSAMSAVAVGCSQNAEKVEKKETAPAATRPADGMQSPHGEMPATPPHGTAGASASAVAGVAWRVPAGWETQAPRPMRVATYAVPAAAGDAEGGECGVFFFGTSQGGDPESNIARWSAQFDGSPAPERSTREANGIPVTIVKIAGTYLAPGGPMMQSQGKKEDFRLLGAIVQAPQGSVFFKLTGPSKTITSAESDFDALIASIEKS